MANFFTAFSKRREWKEGFREERKRGGGRVKGGGVGDWEAKTSHRYVKGVCTIAKTKPEEKKARPAFRTR